MITEDTVTFVSEDIEVVTSLKGSRISLSFLNSCAFLPTGQLNSYPCSPHTTWIAELCSKNRCNMLQVEDQRVSTSRIIRCWGIFRLLWTSRSLPEALLLLLKCDDSSRTDKSSVAHSTFFNPSLTIKLSVCGKHPKQNHLSNLAVHFITSALSEIIVWIFGIMPSYLDKILVISVTCPTAVWSVSFSTPMVTVR